MECNWWVLITAHVPRYVFLKVHFPPRIPVSGFHLAPTSFLEDHEVSVETEISTKTTFFRCKLKHLQLLVLLGLVDGDFFTFYKGKPPSNHFLRDYVVAFSKHRTSKSK